MLVDVAGATFWTDASGEGAPLVFVHGLALDHRLWAPQLATFRDQYWVLAYDKRGAGLSSAPSEPHSHAEDLAALLRHFKIGNAHVIAASDGTVHALELALAHPGLVRSLTLVDCSVTPAPTLQEHLPDITAPTLVVIGERDSPENQKLATLLADRLPYALKRVLPGEGHLPNPADSSALNATLAQFLESLPWRDGEAEA